MGLRIGVDKLLIGKGNKGSLSNLFGFIPPYTFDVIEGITDVGTIATNKEGSEFHLGYPAPAPDEDGEVTLTPDNVGDNPVTWYYRMWWNDPENHEGRIGGLRSKLSDEYSVVIGDSTTEIIVYGPAVPFWAEGFDFAFGTESGVYNKFIYAEYNEGGKRAMTNLPINGSFLLYEESVVDIPIKYHPIPYATYGQAPTNISITPDAVGNNPVTWYYKVVQMTIGYKRTEPSVEQNYTVGDSTTELIFNCTHVDYDETDLFVILAGTESGVYTNLLMASFTPPSDMVPIADVQLPFDLITGVNIAYGEGLETFALSFTQILLSIYDNELFLINSETGDLSFINPPNYETPLDTDKDNIYNVLVVATNGEDTTEKVINVTILDSETDLIVNIPYTPNGAITDIGIEGAMAAIWDDDNSQFIFEYIDLGSSFYFKDNGVDYYGEWDDIEEEWIIHGEL